jgi:DNA adenine methylase
MTRKQQFIEEMIVPNLPNDWTSRAYIEPFGGSFAVGNYLKNRRSDLSTIYNDIVVYDNDVEIKADCIFHTDYSKFLDSFNLKNCFFYIDPPYFGKEDWYFLKKDNKEFHIALFEKLKTLKASFLLSYEDCIFIRELYKDFKIITYEGSNKIFRHEILIKNF